MTRFVGMVRSAVVLGVVLSSHAASAQQKAPSKAPERIEGRETRIEKFGPPEIAAVAGRVAPDSRGVIMRGSEDGHAQYIYNLRQNDSDLEMHEDWDDIFVVQGGTGKLEFASRNINSKKLMAGEFRGGALQGNPRFVKLEPNTVVRIPAGVPHIVRPTPGEKLVYLVVKVMRTGVSTKSKPQTAARTGGQ